MSQPIGPAIINHKKSKKKTALVSLSLVPQELATAVLYNVPFPHRHPPSFARRLCRAPEPHNPSPPSATPSSVKKTTTAAAA